MNEKARSTYKIIIAALVIVIGSFVAVKTSDMTGGGAYVACAGNSVSAWTMAEDGSLKEAEALPRGSQISPAGDRVQGPEGQKLRLVKTEEEEVYIDEDCITSDPNDLVREQEVFVRTPATVFEEAEGPEIAGFAPKGTKLKVTGYDFIEDSGNVHRYAVEGEDEKGEELKGYVYGKYMAFSQEDADAVYNENGEYDKAKKNVYGIELYGGQAKNLDYYPQEKVKIEGKEFCANARTMYLNYYAALHNDDYIKLIKESGCNAVVIDLKSGILAYESPVAKKLAPTAFAKAHVSKDEYVAAVKEFKEAGIYTIGRITCFNDKYYAKDHPEDCIKSKSGGTGWPSAYNRNVWEYNVKLAIEAVELMDFDEIQFDYVRFPEEAYDLSTAGGTDFRNEYDEEKAQAIQNFCMYAADCIHDAGAYFSVDVFGECSNGYVTAYGQYWPAISNVVDAISSMPYTDHFGDADTWSEPGTVMSSWAAGAAKGQSEIPTPAAARTWITGYNTPYWAPSVDYDYGKMMDQIRALEKAGLDGGFIPWNSGSELYKYKEYSEIWKER